MAPDILRRHELEKKLQISRSSIYAMISEGKFPTPIKVGRRAVGWRSSDIEKWLEDMQEDQNA